LDDGSTELKKTELKSQWVQELPLQAMLPERGGESAAASTMEATASLESAVQSPCDFDQVVRRMKQQARERKRPCVEDVLSAVRREREAYKAAGGGFEKAGELDATSTPSCSSTCPCPSALPGTSGASVKNSAEGSSSATAEHAGHASVHKGPNGEGKVLKGAHGYYATEQRSCSQGSSTMASTCTAASSRAGSSSGMSAAPASTSGQSGLCGQGDLGRSSTGCHVDHGLGSGCHDPELQAHASLKSMPWQKLNHIEEGSFWAKATAEDDGIEVSSETMHKLFSNVDDTKHRSSAEWNLQDDIGSGFALSECSSVFGGDSNADKATIVDVQWPSSLVDRMQAQVALGTLSGSAAGPIGDDGGKRGMIRVSPEEGSYAREIIDPYRSGYGAAISSHEGEMASKSAFFAGSPFGIEGGGPACALSATHEKDGKEFMGGRSTPAHVQDAAWTGLSGSTHRPGLAGEGINAVATSDVTGSSAHRFGRRGRVGRDEMEGDSAPASEITSGSDDEDALPGSLELNGDLARGSLVSFDQVLGNVGSEFRRGCSPVDEETIRTFGGPHTAGAGFASPERRGECQPSLSLSQTLGQAWQASTTAGPLELPLGDQPLQPASQADASNGRNVGGTHRADTKHSSMGSAHQGRQGGAGPLSDGSACGTPTASPAGSTRRHSRAGSSSELSPESVGGVRSSDRPRQRLGSGSGRRTGGQRPQSARAAEDETELAGQKLEKAFQCLAAEGRVRVGTDRSGSVGDGRRHQSASKLWPDSVLSDEHCSPSTPCSSDRMARRSMSRASTSPALEIGTSKMALGGDGHSVEGMVLESSELRDRALTFGELHAAGFGPGGTFPATWTLQQAASSSRVPLDSSAPSHNLLPEIHFGATGTTWPNESVQGVHDLNDPPSRDGSPCASPSHQARLPGSKRGSKSSDMFDGGHGDDYATDTHGGMSPRGSLDAGCTSSGHQEEPSSPRLGGHRSSLDMQEAYSDGLGLEDADMSMTSSPSQVTVKLRACLARFPPMQREEVLSQLIEIDKQLNAGNSPSAPAAPAGLPGKATNGLSLLAMMPPPRSLVLTKAQRSKSWGGGRDSSSDGSGEDEEGNSKHKTRRKGPKGSGDESSGADVKGGSSKPPAESTAAPPPPKVKGAPPPIKGKGKDKEGKGKGKGAPPPPAKGAGKAKGKGKADKKAVEQAKSKHELAKLKPLGWQKLNHVEEGTLWAIDDLDDIEVSMAAIEQLFAWGASGAKKSASVGAEEQKEVSLTTPQRVMSISIGLHSLRHHSMAKVRAAIWALSEEVLTQEATHILLVCDPKTHQPTVLPNKDEIEAAKEYLKSGQPQEVLDDASKFIVAVHDIPFLFDRLLLVSFRTTFASSAQSIQQQLNSVASALSEVRDSRRFASMMKLILKTGNLLNQGTARGEARGFRLSALSQLQQMKQVEGSTEPGNPSSLTLIDHLIDLIAEQKPDLLHLADDMPNVPFATRVELDDVKKNINQLRSDLARISRSAATAAGASSAEAAPQQEHVDTFSTAASLFVQQATTEIDALDAALEDVVRTYAEVAEFFGEKTQKASDLLPMHEWVGYVQRFLTDFERAVAAHLDRLERARRKSRRTATRRTLTAARLSRSTLKMDSMLSDKSAGVEGTVRTPTGAFQDAIGGLEGRA